MSCMNTEKSVHSELANLTGFASSMQGGRQENQDDFGFCDTPLGFLFILCDGMGGGPGGKTASAIVKHEIAASICSCNTFTPPEQALRDAFIKANEAIEKKTDEIPSLKGMGSTAVALIIGNQSAFVAHIGDSRFYHIRNDKLVWRTSDHSLVNELVQMRALTEEQARTSPQSNLITRGLGATDNHTPEVTEISYEAGDRFVICTDGIWGMIPTNELVLKLSQGGNVESVVRTIQEEIDGIGERQGGSQDNHTIALIDIWEHSKKKENMIRRLKTIISILVANCALLILSVVFVLMRTDNDRETRYKEENEALYADMMKYKQKYEAVNNSSTKDIIEIIQQNELLKSDTIILNEKINSLNREVSLLTQKIDSLEKVISVQEKTQKANNIRKAAEVISPCEIANQITMAFNDIINCKKTSRTDAVEFINKKYEEILTLLDDLDNSTKTKYKETTQKIRDGFKNKDVTKDIDRVQETIEANKHYFVPTKKSSDRAQYFRKSIKDANIK